MSPTPEQRAQVLYLHQVEGVSVVVIAVMAAAMRPSSKGRVERQLHLVHAHLHRKVAS